MKSLKELVVENIALTERELDAKEKDVVLGVTEFMRNEENDYIVVDNKLQHWQKVTNRFLIKEYINGNLFKRTETYPNGIKQSEAWYNEKGKVHREDGPAITEWHENGNKKYEAWKRNDKFYREQIELNEILPAAIEWYSDGNKRHEIWYENGKRHGFGTKPAVKSYYANGEKAYEGWYRYGKLHNLCAPAEISWYENGKKMYEAWFRDGERLYDRYGIPIYTAWDINGVIRTYGK